MTTSTSPFNWRGTPSSLSFKRAPNKHKGAPPPLLSGSGARNTTASINTERDPKPTGSIRANKGRQA